jgi:hypothetical protein
MDYDEPQTMCGVAAESLIERDYLERAADPKIYKYLA